MVRILVSVVAGDLLAAACLLFDHQIRPPSTAKRTTAISSPFGFMRYLLFHQVARPKPTTPSGKITAHIQNSAFSFCVVRFSGRSSVSLGRMEIRSSSEASQLIIFVNRSPLPSWRDPARLLVAQAEEPITTKRPGVAPE